MKAPADGNSRRGILTRTTPADRGAVRLPALAPHLQFHEIGEQQALLVSESFNTLLHGRLYCDLLPLLDGRRPQDEIAAALEGVHAAADIGAAVGSLSARGYVVSGDHGMDRCRAAWWSSLGASPRWVEQRLAASRIAVEGDDGRLIRRLEEAGAGVGADGPGLTVIVCDDYLEARLEDVNRRRLEAGAAWMLLRPRGMEALFGPVFRADGQGPCWACLAQRLRGHEEVHSFLRNFAGEEAAFKPFAAEPAVLEGLYGLIAAEIVKWLVLDEAAPIHDHAVAMNTGAFASSQHRVMRRPQCPACGEEALHRPDRPPVPLSLQASPKTHRNSGGARSVAPEATLAKYRHLVSPVSGVVTWLRRTTDETDPWLHVYWAGGNHGMKAGASVRSDEACAARAPARAARGSNPRSAPSAKRSSATRAPAPETRSAAAGASSTSPWKTTQSIRTMCSCSATVSWTMRNALTRKDTLTTSCRRVSTPRPKSTGPRCGR